MGGEQMSLALSHAHSKEFVNAGYTDLRIRDREVGAQTRQYGNLSYTRVYQAGHQVSAFQPEIAFTIFQRVLHGQDVATGSLDIDFLETQNLTYATIGPAQSSSTNTTLPEIPDIPCYTLNVEECTDEQRRHYFDGTAVVEDYFITDFGDGTCSPNPVKACHSAHGSQNAALSNYGLNIGMSTPLFMIISILVLTTCGLFLAELIHNRKSIAKR